MSRTDERFMERALELAARAPFTSPNPKVGALVVRAGAIVAEAWHEGAGTEHAERLALTDIDATGATLYVTLEPCTHHGRTPPCAPLIAESGVSRVVVAMADPDERVSGRGIEYLRTRGVEVEAGVLAPEARSLNAEYIHHRTTGRPLVTVKLALTLDGRLGTGDPGARWITGEVTRTRVHRRRLAADAVMVGAGTVIADDPLLTVRYVPATRQPTRIVVDARGRVAPTAKVFGDEAPTIVATTDLCAHDRQIAYKEAGAEVLVLPHQDDGVDLSTLVERFGERQMLSLYCEGGAALATSLLRDDLVDRLELHYGPVIAGGGEPTIGDLGGAVRRFGLVAVERSGDDVVVAMEKT